MKNPFSTSQWLVILGACVGSVSYVHANFPTLREFVFLISRLDRIEGKLDDVGRSLGVRFKGGGTGTGTAQDAHNRDTD